MFTCIECGNEYNKVNGDTEERMCDECINGEQEYDVTVTASFSVMAKTQEAADDYIFEQFYNGNREYTSGVEKVEGTAE